MKSGQFDKKVCGRRDKVNQVLLENSGAIPYNSIRPERTTEIMRGRSLTDSKAS